MKMNWKKIVKISVIAVFLATLFLSIAGIAEAKESKEWCDDFRREHPEGDNIGRDIEYDFHCGWLKGTTGGVPTGSLTLPEEHADKYDTGIVARDPETGEILGLIGLIIKLTNWALGFVGVVALVAFIYGGYVMVANFGNDEMTGKGKKVLIGASMGIVIILLSFTAVNALLGAAGGRPGGELPRETEGTSQAFIEATLAGLEDTLFSIFNSFDDVKDLCPGTPKGKKVSVVGCATGEFPSDTDGDGVINLFDLDDNNNGVPDTEDSDDDGDDISDEKDFCPGTLLFSVARPYAFEPYKGLIERGVITKDQVRTGAEAEGERPLILPYVKISEDGIGAAEDINRRIGCAVYEGASDTDGDGYPNCLVGGPEEIECEEGQVQYNNCDCDDDNDGELDKIDPDNDGDGVPDGAPIAQTGGEITVPKNVVIQDFTTTVYEDDTVQFDMRVLFPNVFQASTDELSPPLSFIPRVLAQDEQNEEEMTVNPVDYEWIQDENNPPNVPLTLTDDSYVWEIVPTKTGIYKFRLYEVPYTPESDPVENASGESVVTLRVLSRSSVRVITPEESLFPELIDKFERDILLTCSRLPQTYDVRVLCDETTGTLIAALNEFTENPTEEVMRKLLEEIDKLRVVVEAIPKVIARMVVIPGSKGSAPFSAYFDASESIDPFNVQRDDTNYEWCFGYTSVAESLDCPPDKRENGSYVTRVFDKPGSYSVQLRVDSPELIEGVKQAMDGLAMITIIVEPPSANISFKVGTSSDSLTDVTDKRVHEVLYSGARVDPGVIFDASGTTDYSETGTSNILGTKWSFGDGSIEELDGFVGQRTHVYTEPGVYNVIFEVKDNRFQLSRKILELVVTDIVADLEIFPASKKGDVTTQFTFDASGSRVEGGQVEAYLWEIIDRTQQEKLVDSTLGGNRDLTGAIVNYVFPKVGLYRVKVTVEASGGRTHSRSEDIQIVSRAPVARFSWRVLDKRKPATVFLDASGSSDPDPNTDLQYSWFADGDPIQLTGNEKVPMMGNYTFDSVGQHRVELEVADDTNVTHRVSEIVKIDSTLDVDFTADRFSAHPDQKIEFTAISASAAGYFWDFGDGTREYSELKTISHSYGKAGNYSVILTVDNLDGEENSISKRIRVGDKDSPIAAIRVLLNGLEIEPDERVCGSGDGILVDRLSTLNFDGSESVNTDGTSRGLQYSWNFDDGQRASSRSSVHKFEELTVGSDCYEITLTATDRVTGKSDTSSPVFVRVENIKPIAIALDIIEPKEKITPVSVPVNLVGSKDQDGRIVDYTWWYYDAQAPNKKIDVHVTAEPKTTFTIGPRAKEGIESTYHFVVEMKDNDSGKVDTENLIGKSQPFIVTNGPSLTPIVEFNVDKSRVKVGEKITFTSTSRDVLGRYIPTNNYKWDFYGDGRYDREIVGPEVSFAYDRPGTFTPRLKVLSDGISDTYETEIIVEAVTEKPEAAFLFIKSGNKITFINNSTVDPQLDATDLRYAWDFDTEVDSDGNSIKDDDVDSAQVNPSNIYDIEEERDVEVKLTVTDAMGQSDDVKRKVITPKKDEFGALGVSVQKKLRAVLETDPPADELDKKVYLKETEGNVTFIMKRSTGKIKTYRLDLNTYEDSNSDGISDNDTDNSTHQSLDDGSPFQHTYEKDSGRIRAQLTIEDFQGATDSTFIDIILNESGLSPFQASFDPDSIFLVSGMAPIAIFTVREDVIVPEKEVTFDATSSSFPEEKIREYRWDFDGDGEVDESSSEPMQKFTFKNEGVYQVTLGIFSETDLYAEYSEAVIVRELYSNPTADFSYNINDLEVSFANLSKFDANDPGNRLDYEWKFIPVSDEGEEEAGLSELVGTISLSEETLETPAVVTNEVETYKGAFTRPIVLQSVFAGVEFDVGTEVLDADDNPYERAITVPKIISAPKGTLDFERKIIDAFLVASVKPLFTTKDIRFNIDLSLYEGVEDPSIAFFNLSEKSWIELETKKNENVLSAVHNNLGIFALTDKSDASVVQTRTEAEESFKKKLKISETSTDKDPVKVFDNYGIYKVVLTVVDKGGRKDSLIRLINLEPGVLTEFVPEPPLPVEEIVIEEVISAEDGGIDEELISEEAVAVTKETPSIVSDTTQQKKGGISWFWIITGFILFVVFIGGVIVVLTKIKDAIAHDEGSMPGQPPGAPPIPGTQPSPPRPTVEVVEGAPSESSKAPAESAKGSPKPPVSQPKEPPKPPSATPPPKSPTPPASPLAGGGTPPPASKGGDGPIPDWLKR